MLHSVELFSNLLETKLQVELHKTDAIVNDHWNVVTGQRLARQRVLYLLHTQLQLLLQVLQQQQLEQ